MEKFYFKGEERKKDIKEEALKIIDSIEFNDVKKINRLRQIVKGL